MKHCLVHIFSPTHIISSISAIQSIHVDEKFEVIFIIHNPMWEKVVKEIEHSILSLTRKNTFIKNVITIYDNNLFSKMTLAEVKLFLNKKLKDFQLDEIYYSHDIGNLLYYYLCISYPEAKRICFGDAFGIVYEKYHRLSWNNITVAKPTAVNLFIQNIYINMIKLLALFGVRYPINLNRINFLAHEAALIIPMDPSGHFLDHISLTVCPKELVLDVISQCMDSASELNDYIQDILNIYHNRNKVLLLTENGAEGNFLSFEKDIEMYCTMIRENAPKNSVVFLKSHPGEMLPRNEKIQDKLRNNYEIVELDKKFKRYPVELMKDLVLNSSVICVSYPNLSLKYLYDIDVINPWDEDGFIEKWCYQDYWFLFKNGNKLYTEPLKNLDLWDGNNVLWSGK